MALKAYSLARDGTLHLTPHFRVREFVCRDGSDPIFVEEELAALLEAIRLHFGCPVAITSGFRTAAHNASIPGASPHSQHLYGRAADFRVEGVSVAEAAAYAETLLPGKGGIGATRPAKAAPAAGYIWTPAAPKPAGRAESGPSSDLKFTTKIRKENPL